MSMDKNMEPKVSVKMSQRLITLSNMLAEGSENLSDIARIDELMEGNSSVSFGRVADVGCDHGYISIYLVQSGIAESAIAMDVRKGPLTGALSNIRDYGLEDRITTRLSDGLKELKPGEADSLVIAGMGGKLMIRILEEGKPSELGIRAAVLQPQSEFSEFRQYLRGNGYVILDERVVFEDGKYYFPMKVLLGNADNRGVFDEVIKDLMSATGTDSDTAISICNRFGECNIKRKDKLLLDYLKHGMEVSASILKNLDENTHPQRYHEVEKEYRENEILVRYYS